MAVKLYQKGSTTNYVYIGDDGAVVATYGENVTSPDLSQYTLVGDAPSHSTPPRNERPLDRRVAKYLAYLGAGHSPSVASSLSGYTP